MTSLASIRERAVIWRWQARRFRQNGWIVKGFGSPFCLEAVRIRIYPAPPMAGMLAGARS